MRFLKRINDRGTVTLPAEVREALQVEAGDIVEFEVIGIVRRGTRDHGDSIDLSDSLARRPIP